jgi:hypothetical protein
MYEKDMKPQVIIGIIVVIIVLGAGAWYVYSNPALAAKFGLRPAPTEQSTTGTSTPRRFGNPGGFAMGTIEVLNDSGFTVTLSNGTTKVIDVTATTTIQNYATASSTPTMISINQLSVGEQVFVIGEPQSDGSIAARMISTGTLPTRGQGGQGGGAGHFRGTSGGTPEPD